MRHDDGVFVWAREYFGHHGIDPLGEFGLGLRASDTFVMSHSVSNCRRGNELLIKPGLRATFGNTVGLLPQSRVEGRNLLQHCRYGIGRAPRPEKVR